MKILLLMVGIAVAQAFTASADAVLVVTNGSGIYYSSYAGMAFTDANGNYVFIGGTQGFVEIFYANGSHQTYPFDTQTRTFSGRDGHGNFTAIVRENLVTIHRGGGGGRGDGYPGNRTVVSGGEIIYIYHSLGTSGKAPTDES